MNQAFTRANVSIEEINKKAKQDLDRLIFRGEEAFHTQIDQIVDQVIERQAKIIMLAGPSSSGKTTSSYQIKKGLISKGKNAFVLSMDDFFKDIKDVPLKDDGEPDIENLCAMDVQCLRQCMQDIITIKPTKFPVYDFVKRCRKKDWIDFNINENDIVIVEGIHALNPIFTENFEKSKIYKVYVHCNTNFTLKSREFLPARMLRLIRRIIRDDRDRGISPERTLNMWDDICAGEEQNIRPFKSYANYHLNSSHFYEPMLYKQRIKQLIENFENNVIAMRIIDRLKPFEFDIAHNQIPADSLVREFIGKADNK